MRSSRLPDRWRGSVKVAVTAAQVLGAIYCALAATGVITPGVTGTRILYVTVGLSCLTLTWSDYRTRRAIHAQQDFDDILDRMSDDLAATSRDLAAWTATTQEDQ